MISGGETMHRVGNPTQGAYSGRSACLSEGCQVKLPEAVRDQFRLVEPRRLSIHGPNTGRNISIHGADIGMRAILGSRNTGFHNTFRVGDGGFLAGAGAAGLIMRGSNTSFHNTGYTKDSMPRADVDKGRSSGHGRTQHDAKPGHEKLIMLGAAIAASIAVSFTAWQLRLASLVQPAAATGGLIFGAGEGEVVYY